jgi:lauroyl/myristoyl acyltransferase
MNLQGLLNSHRAGATALKISRSIPPGLGYPLARFIADRIATHHATPLVAAIRANQRVIRGENISAIQLDQACRDSIRHIAHSYYTLFHWLNDPSSLQKLVIFDPRIEEVIERSQQGKQGLIVAGMHMGSFDIVAQAAAYHGLRAFALSLPQPGESVEWQHRFRRQSGLEILSASIGNLRQAIERLIGGETMLTGIDRPVITPKYKPLFFGRPASLPCHYITLALKARVPIVVMASNLCPDGRYRILSSDYIELKPQANRKAEILENAERILKIAADFVRQAPHQWSIYQPVWPDASLDMV